MFINNKASRVLFQPEKRNSANVFGRIDCSGVRSFPEPLILGNENTFSLRKHQRTSYLCAVFLYPALEFNKYVVNRRKQTLR